MTTWMMAMTGMGGGARMVFSDLWDVFFRD